MGDACAKRGRDTPSLEVPDLPYPSYKLLKTKVHQAINRVWNERWQADTENYRQTRRWLPSVDPWFSAKLLGEKREVLSEYILIITGHNFGRRHNSLVEVERVRRGAAAPESLVPPFCQLCCFDVPDDKAEWKHMDEFL